MNFLWILVFLLEITKCFLMGNTFFEIRIRRYWMIFVTTLIYFGIIFFKSFLIHEFSLITVIFVAVNLLVMINSEIKKRITWIIKIFFLVSCADGIVETILKLLIGIGFENSVIYFIVNNMITISVILLIRLIKKKHVVKYDGFMKVVVYICAIIMGGSTIIFIMDTEAGNASKLDYIFSNILIIIYYLSIISIVLFLLYVNDMNRNMKKYLETERLLKDTQKNYYETMLEKEENTRKFRHDMINHLIYVHNLMVQNQQKEALDYIENLQDGIKNIQRRCYYTGNSVIDVMLNHYIQLLEKDVSVSVSGNYTKEAVISNVELCTIFSNLIKNAVEAVNFQKEGEKYLKVVLHSGNENMKIEIINSTEKDNPDNSKKKSKEKLPETVKKDRKNHGIGLKNVKETVEKNNGIFQWDSDGCCFKVLVVLPCKNLEK